MHVVYDEYSVVGHYAVWCVVYGVLYRLYLTRRSL
jgi:hypothetical protein